MSYLNNLVVQLLLSAVILPAALMGANGGNCRNSWLETVAASDRIYASELEQIEGKILNDPLLQSILDLKILERTRSLKPVVLEGEIATGKTLILSTLVRNLGTSTIDHSFARESINVGPPYYFIIRKYRDVRSKTLQLTSVDQTNSRKDLLVKISNALDENPLKLETKPFIQIFDLSFGLKSEDLDWNSDACLLFRRLINRSETSHSRNVLTIITARKGFTEICGAADRSFEKVLIHQPILK